jgi:hypothetical protein
MFKTMLGRTTFLAVFCCLPAVAQRLSDFLGVKAWEGSVTVKGTADSSLTSAMGTDHWTLSWDANLQFRLDTFVAAGQFWQGTFTGGNVTVKHKNVNTGPSGCVVTSTVDASGLPRLAGGPDAKFFLYAGPGELYSFLTDTMFADGTTTMQTVCPDNSSSVTNPGTQVAWWPDDLMRTPVFPFPNTGLELSGTGTYHMTFPLPLLGFVLSGQAPPEPAVTVTWSFRPLGVAETEVVVESAALDGWRPLGTLDGKRGNTIDLTAKLLEKGKVTPPQGAQVESWSWDFVSVSREPGVLMNYPLLSAADHNPDLRFEESPAFSLDAEGQHAKSLPTALGTQSTVTVGSYDWGGFGAVKVTCTVVGGKQYVGYLNTDPAQTEIRLPKRPVGGFIAESWKRAKGVMALADNSDDEDSPIGDGNKGDGLTLYQEYRGFIENGQRIEGNPARKDYFINMPGDAYLQGVTLFKNLSGLEVHYRMGDDEMEADRVINRNYDAGPRVTNQHAVWIRTNILISGFAITVGGPGTPGMIDVIYMPMRVPNAYQGSLPGVQVDYRNTTLAHELMHACNVYHHGDSGDYEATWVRPQGTDNVTENGQPITVIWEATGENVNYKQPELPDVRKVRIGAFQGRCSGDMSCIMKYDDCDAYVPRANASIRYRADEQWGNSLCVSEQGTGTNQVGRTPQSRYGPAASGRGVCALQILVNDAVRATRR